MYFLQKVYRKVCILQSYTFLQQKAFVCMGILYYYLSSSASLGCILHQRFFISFLRRLVFVQNGSTLHQEEKKKKINKSSSQYSQDRLRLCVCFFFYMSMYSARAVIFYFFFVNDEYLVLWNEAHSFPPPVIGVSQEQTLICAFQQSGPPLSIHLQ